MTDAEINVAIAETCGWRKEDEVWMWTRDGIDCTCPDLWDWANDLNAMHEAEQSLSDWQWAQYAGILYDSVYYGSKGTVARRAYSATARQRAEAFLKATEKWKEAAE